jgi:hypothetical protein
VVAFCTVKFAASVPQKVTAVAPAKLAPMIDTPVRPAAIDFASTIARTSKKSLLL